MKLLVVICLVVIFLIQDSHQLENLLNTPMHECIKCLCHARTGCFRRQNCASYSINMDYWQKAGSPTINVGDPENVASFQACMKDENCILNTIKLYTDGYSSPQCDCNDVYDCRDRLMIHLNGQNCKKQISTRYMERYNNCTQGSNLEKLNMNNRCTPEAQ